jgi:uncharacterized protein YidB (DUF937 family)
MASNSTPSMVALLSLLAIAGYQNRDKIGAALNNLTNGDGGGLGGLAGDLSNALGGSGQTSNGGALGGLLSGLGAGGLAGGLGDLLNSFRNAGHGEVADSWVKPNVPTQSVSTDQVSQAIGDDTLKQLSERTGLSRDEILKRLSTVLPGAVDKLTPGGQMPNEQQIKERLPAAAAQVGA